mmetsp:Transcript_9056/g.26881  ORF Transcript_9056/g.26881 Transcript_9056/m.26881 type:complete len:342 (-) Transcript_9056:402-1427(-)
MLALCRSMLACDQQSVMSCGVSFSFSFSISFSLPSSFGCSSWRWLIIVMKLSLRTTGSSVGCCSPGVAVLVVVSFSPLSATWLLLFSLPHSSPLSPLLPATLSICRSRSISWAASFPRTAFCRAFLALRTTFLGASNSVPSTETPPRTRTSPKGGGNGRGIMINPRPSMVPPATPTPVLLILRSHRWARVGEQCSRASCGLSATTVTIDDSEFCSRSEASCALMAWQGRSLMARQKSPSRSAECDSKPLGSMLLICSSLVVVISCVPLGSWQRAFCVVLCSTMPKEIPRSVSGVGLRQNARTMAGLQGCCCCCFCRSRACAGSTTIVTGPFIPMSLSITDR